MKSIKVRFNLSRGPNYMKWKIQYPSGAVEYCDPCNTQLVMYNCTLKNSKSTALKIFRGESNKTVCAWVLCESVDVRTEDFKQHDVGNQRLKYNPRVAPSWVIDPENKIDRPWDVDDTYYSEISSVDYRLYITKY